MKSASLATAYIGLGSNLGDRLLYLRRALLLLKQEPSLLIRAVSRVYETRPAGGPPQGLYLNATCKLETTLSPLPLLRLLLQTELKLGRVRLEKWGPRTVDLDLLLYDNLIISAPELVLPHPQMTVRDFVLLPLADIAPWVIIPGTGKTVRQLLKECGTTAAPFPARL